MSSKPPPEPSGRNGDAPRAAEAAKFGTFGGVFTPCTLTILGVILFLRLGDVAGQAGLWGVIGIILAAKAITVITALSLSAIATNTRVKGGGVYYLISRSLGAEFGGAIGIVFFIAQAVAVAMYVVGFTEAFVDVVPALADHFRHVASIVNAVVFLCVVIGAGWTVKVQYGILAVMGLSLLAFVSGAIPEVSLATLQANMRPHYLPGSNLFVMFALFFPAVTGIMAGANMSGDLRVPGRSIPAGTLGAIGATTVVYLGIAVLLCAVRPADTLVADTMIMKGIAPAPWLITAGIFAATLSSALGSMMGAPRILQACARDNLFRSLRLFAAGSGVLGEPRRAIVLTWLIAQAAILIGDLDAIAPLITMAFLLTYGLLNLATFYEGFSRNPSFRPQFRFFHWSVSLVGAVGCFVIMLLLAPLSSALSIAVMALLYADISRREIVARWGDVRRGTLFERARRSLLRLEDESYHPKNWRPIILVLMGAGGQRSHLAVMGHWLSAGHGLLTLGQVIPGKIPDLLERRRNQENILLDFIRREELRAFPAVAVMPDLHTGVLALVQAQGVGGLRPNTVLVGWPHSDERIAPFGQILRTVSGLGRSLLVVRCAADIEDPWEVPTGTVDVWWRGETNGALMLLLAHLLVRETAWRGRVVRLLRVIPSAAGRDDVLKHLNGLVANARIRAHVGVVVDTNVEAAIQRTSQHAAVVFLGFMPPPSDGDTAFYTHTNALAGPLRRVMLVYSAGGVDLDT